MKILPITTNKLFLVAGLLWTAAGAGILQIGIKAYLDGPFTPWIPPATALIFLLFYFVIFRKMVQKNEQRILSFESQKTSILHFLDKKGYLIMAFMMILGIALRTSGLVPLWFFAFFYTGLGTALLLAGLTFFAKYIKLRINTAPVS
jgi:hypothetical protein